MGFLCTNHLSEVKNGEFGFDFKVLIKTGGFLMVKTRNENEVK